MSLLFFALSPVFFLVFRDSHIYSSTRGRVCLGVRAEGHANKNGRVHQKRTRVIFLPVRVGARARGGWRGSTGNERGRMKQASSVCAVLCVCILCVFCVLLVEVFMCVVLLFGMWFGLYCPAAATAAALPPPPVFYFLLFFRFFYIVSQWDPFRLLFTFLLLFFLLFMQRLEDGEEGGGKKIESLASPRTQG